MFDDASRREFLKRTAAAVAAAAATEAATSRAAKSANDKLVVGLVGCGGRGTHDADLFRKTPNVELKYVCDVDEGRRHATAQKLGVDSKNAVSDMRRILDDKSVDIVVVGTPDHWHSPAAILACDAGKHVYVEKPISHNIREGRLLVEASARNKVLVQHGTQVRSTPTIIEAVKLLREGMIGDVLVAKCWNIQMRRAIAPGQNIDPPAGFDYENWVGPATMIPYRTNRVHQRWTMWYHFGAGEAGNDGVHDLDYCRWGLGVETHPNKVSGQGGKYFTDDEKEFPDTQQVTFEYSGDGKVGSQRMLIYEQRLWSTNYPHNCDSGSEYYGTKGQLFVSRRGKLQVIDGKNKPVTVDVPLGPQDDVLHVKNLCDAIRTGVKLNADALVGHLSSSLAHLANICTRVGRSFNFDPQKEQIVGDAEANALVRREYRDHWGTPKNV
jgi:predicted dehydrogenase